MTHFFKLLLLPALVVVFTTVPASTLHAQTPKRIVWFANLPENPSRRSEELFWNRVRIFMQAAADDLGVELDIRPFERNRIKLRQCVREVFSSKDKPDGVIFHNFQKMGKELLDAAEKARVPAFIFNACPSEETAGLPRTKYRFWIGGMTPDDEHVGYVLAQTLARQAMDKGQTDSAGIVQCLGIAGNSGSMASRLRVEGFNRFIEESETAVSRGMVNGDWSYDKAREMFSPFSKRFPEVRVFWAASDLMAMGIIDAARDEGLVPGENVFVGGVDWLPEVVKSVRDGIMTASVGGHYVEGAWALILMYDYLSGKDFKDIHSTTFKTRLFPVTHDNPELLSRVETKITEDNVQKIDFKQYSRMENPDMKEYHFEIQDLLGNL